jgi:hypothetical protein
MGPAGARLPAPLTPIVGVGDLDGALTFQPPGSREVIPDAWAAKARVRGRHLLTVPSEFHRQTCQIRHVVLRRRQAELDASVDGDPLGQVVGNAGRAKDG